MISPRRLLALLCVVMPVCAQADIVVYGANACETWTAERQKGESGANWERPWLFGYLSGVARGSDIDFLKGADPQKLLAWIDRFCQDNPKANLGEAAEVLAQALVRAMPPAAAKSGPAPATGAGTAPAPAK